MQSFTGCGMPERTTLLYQKIPPRIRGIWSMGSSSSQDALTAIRAARSPAEQREQFRRHTAGWVFLPSYTLGAGLRLAGLAPLLSTTLAAGTSAAWFDPPGTTRGNLRRVLMTGLAGGLRYPANPPPSLSWFAGKPGR